MRGTCAFTGLIGLVLVGCGGPDNSRTTDGPKPGEKPAAPKPDTSQPKGTKGTPPTPKPDTPPKADRAAADAKMAAAGLVPFDPQPHIPAPIRIYEIHRDRSQVVLADLPEPGIPWGLRLGHPSVTVASLKLIKPSPDLKHIDLAGKRVGNDGLAALAPHAASLEELLCAFTECTDAGMVHVKALTKLRRFDPSTNPITDAGLADLAGLTDLADLDLSFTRVTDAGMEHVGALKNLTTLSVKATEVTDLGVRPFYRLKKLTELHLPFTVTPDEKKKLQAALPKCKIYP